MKTIKIKYFWINNIGSVCSIFGLIWAIINNKILLLYGCAGILILSNLIFGIYSYYYNRELVKFIDKSLENYHNIFHGMREPVIQLINSLEGNKRFKKDTFESYILSVLDYLRDIFTRLTDDECSVSLKLINPSNGDEVQTYLRDTFSKAKRVTKGSGISLISKNTDFNSLYSDKNITYFFSNSLKNESNYYNTTPNWEKLYNATIVAPIRHLVNITKKGEPEYVILGFLCIDNFKGNFESNRAKYAIGIVVDALYNLFYLYQRNNESRKVKKNQ